jgi:hypothetical protein
VISLRLQHISYPNSEYEDFGEAPSQIRTSGEPSDLAFVYAPFLLSQDNERARRELVEVIAVIINA